MRLRDMRAEYLKRATVESGWVLCCFCRFVRWANEDPICMHPLADRERFGVGGNYLGMEPGDDCWAFRPGSGYPFDRLDEMWREQDEAGE